MTKKIDYLKVLHDLNNKILKINQEYQSDIAELQRAQEVIINKIQTDQHPIEPAPFRINLESRLKK